MNIRLATVKDVKQIHSLIEFYADRKEMLHRPLNDIYENLQEFCVCEDMGRVVGCGALHVSWEDLAEIKALAVSLKYQKKGIGKSMVSYLEKRAAQLGIKRVFALTFKPSFFKGLGYKRIKRDELPHKIWGECVKCHLFPDCGEIPLAKNLKKR